MFTSFDVVKSIREEMVEKETGLEGIISTALKERDPDITLTKEIEEEGEEGEIRQSVKEREVPDEKTTEGAFERSPASKTMSIHSNERNPVLLKTADVPERGGIREKEAREEEFDLMSVFV
jgi:hypothetical protein